MEIQKLDYQADNYSLRMMQSVEHKIISLAKQNHLPGYDKEDLAQELRLHLWKKIHLYDPGGAANFSTWCNRVLRNKIIDLYDLRSDCLDPTNHLMGEGLHDITHNPRVITHGYGSDHEADNR